MVQQIAQRRRIGMCTVCDLDQVDVDDRLADIARSERRVLSARRRNLFAARVVSFLVVSGCLGLSLGAWLVVVGLVLKWL